jgi:hypothetical protein
MSNLKIIKNRNGSALLYTVLISTFLAGVIFFFYQSMANLSNVRGENVSSLRVRTALEGIIDYTRRAVNNRWCMDMSNFKVIKSNQRPCLEWEEGFLLRLLMSKADRIETVFERVKAAGAPSGLKEEAEDCSTQSIRCARLSFGPVDVNSISPELQTILKEVMDDPSALGQKSVKEKKVKDVKIEITKMKHTALPQYSNGTLLKIYVELGLTDNGFFSENPHGEAVIAFYPRELNQFALVVANDLRLDGGGGAPLSTHDFSTATHNGPKNSYTGKSLIFKSPVFVNGNLVLPKKETDATLQKYSPVTFNDKVYLGEGVIKQVGANGELTGFAPKSMGDPLTRYSTQSTQFGGLKKGIRRDMLRDYGLDVLFGPGNGSSALANNYVDCKDKIAVASNPLMTAESDLVFKRDGSGNIILAMTDNGGDGNGNEFRAIAVNPNFAHRAYKSDNVNVQNNSSALRVGDTQFYKLTASNSTLDTDRNSAPSSSSSSSSGSDGGDGSSDQGDGSNNGGNGSDASDSDGVDGNGQQGGGNSDGGSGSSENENASDNQSGNSDKGYFVTHDFKVKNENGDKVSKNITDLENNEVSTSTSIGVVLKVDVKLGAYDKDDDGNDLTASGRDFKGDEVGTFYLSRDSELKIFSAYKDGTPSSSDEVLTIKTEAVQNSSGQDTFNQLGLSISSNDSSVHKGRQVILNVTPVEFGSTLPDPDKDIKFRNVTTDPSTGKKNPLANFEFVFNTETGITPSPALPVNFIKGNSPDRLPASDNRALMVTETVPDTTYSNSTQCNEVPAENNFRGIASTTVSYLDSTKFSWFFKPQDPNRTFEQFINNVNPGADNIIFDDSNAQNVAGGQTFNVVSIARDCIVKNTARLVVGHLVCQRLLIEPRNAELTIIGTIIAGNARLPLSAIQSGINWFSIYNRESLYILRDVGVLGPTPPTQTSNAPGFLTGGLGNTGSNYEKCRKLEMNPNIPLWHMEPDFDQVQARYWCSVNSIRNASDNFTWPRVDPDCGLSGGGGMKCKYDITHVESVELYRRVTR